jgi:hypothetical protein
MLAGAVAGVAVIGQLSLNRHADTSLRLRRKGIERSVLLHFPGVGALLLRHGVKQLRGDHAARSGDVLTGSGSYERFAREQIAEAKRLVAELGLEQD